MNEGTAGLPTAPRGSAGFWAAFSRCLALFVAMLLSGGHLFLPRPLLLLLFFLLFALVPRYPLFRLHRALLVPLAFVAVVIGLECLRPTADLSNIISRTANFLIGILLVNMYLLHGVVNFRRDFLAIVSIFPIQAILTVVLALLIPSAFIGFPESEGRTLAFLFFYSFDVAESTFLVRPMGFFWEPGILQIYLNLALHFCLTGRGRPLFALLCVVAILLTQSTTGVLILAVQLAAFVLQRTVRAGVSPKRVAVAAMFAIALLPVAFGVYFNVVEKLTGVSSGSFYARGFDTFVGLQLALENPWLGIGLNADHYLSLIQKYDLDLGDFSVDLFNFDRGNTNGIVTILFSLGIPLGLALLAGLAGQTLVSSSMIAPLILLLSLMSEPLAFTPFFLAFAFSGFLRIAPLTARWRARTSRSSGRVSGRLLNRATV